MNTTLIIKFCLISSSHLHLPSHCDFASFVLILRDALSLSCVMFTWLFDLATDWHEQVPPCCFDAGDKAQIEGKMDCTWYLADVNRMRRWYLSLLSTERMCRHIHWLTFNKALEVWGAYHYDLSSLCFQVFQLDLLACNHLHTHAFHTRCYTTLCNDSQNAIYRTQR